MFTTKTHARILSLALCAVLILTILPLTSSVASCSHRHDAACGYRENSPCGHVCGDGNCNYTEALSCDHHHDETCGEDEAECAHACADNDYCFTTGIPCDHAHNGVCGYAEPAPCGHQHDTNCGGLPKTEDKPGKNIPGNNEQENSKKADSPITSDDPTLNNGDEDTNGPKQPSPPFITAFAQLHGAIAQQTAPLGVSRDMLHLPGKLDATMDGKPGSVSVTWESAYDGGSAGTYTFVPRVSGEYIVEAGVYLPVITVRVEDGGEPNSPRGSVEPNEPGEPKDPANPNAQGNSSGPSETDGSKPSTTPLITAFAPLNGVIASQTVPLNTALDSLLLPYELTATIDGEPGNVLVAWAHSGYDGGTPGTYTFMPIVRVSFDLKDGVKLPAVTVTVGEGEPGSPGDPSELVKSITSPESGIMALTAKGRGASIVAELSLKVTADSKEVSDAGETITFYFEIDNTGDLVVDSLALDILAFSGTDTLQADTQHGTELSSGAGTTGTAKYTIAPADIEAGSITLTAQVTGAEPDGTPVISNTDSCTVTIKSAPVAPTITSADNTAVVQGAGGTFQVTATGDETISYSVSGQPAGVSIDGTSGLITIVANTDVNVHTFTITASNGVNPDATQSFTLTVNPAPVAPVITSANNTTVINGIGGTFHVTATGSTPITYGLAVEYKGVSIDSTTGLITIAETITIGPRILTITASNGVEPDATQKFTLTVEEEVDLSITMTADKAVYSPGDEITYTIIVTNNGPSTINSMLLGNNLPSDIIDGESSYNGGAHYYGWPGYAILSERFPPGASITWLIRGTVSPTARGSITNTAGVAYPMFGPGFKNYTASVTVSVVVPPTITSDDNKPAIKMSSGG